MSHSYEYFWEWKNTPTKRITQVADLIIIQQIKEKKLKFRNFYAKFILIKSFKKQPF